MSRSVQFAVELITLAVVLLIIMLIAGITRNAWLGFWVGVPMIIAREVLLHWMFHRS